MLEFFFQHGGWKPFEVNRQLVEIGFGESVWTFVKIPVVNSETLRRRWHLKKAAASFLLFFFLLFLRVRVCVCVCVCLSPSICNENRRQTRTRNGKETSTGWNLRPNSFLFQDVNTHTHRTEKNNRIKQICSTSFHTWNQSIRRICHRLEFQIISLPFPHR